MTHKTSATTLCNISVKDVKAWALILKTDIHNFNNDSCNLFPIPKLIPSSKKSYVHLALCTCHFQRQGDNATFRKGFMLGMIFQTHQLLHMDVNVNPMHSAHVH
jgi:hypothetical protein